VEWSPFNWKVNDLIPSLSKYQSVTGRDTETHADMLIGVKEKSAVIIEIDGSSGVHI